MGHVYHSSVGRGQERTIEGDVLDAGAGELEAAGQEGQVEVIAEIPWLDAVTPSILMAVEPELDLAKLARALP